MIAQPPPAPADSPAPSRRIRVFHEAVEKTFRFLKETERLDDLFAKSVALAGGKGYLLPVCELHAGDAPLIRLLAEWREKNAFAYPSQFPVTYESTLVWLRSRVLGVEDRLLFLVLDAPPVTTSSRPSLLRSVTIS